jgi:hypothetical protein
MPRLTSLHLKMIFTTYKSDVHPTAWHPGVLSVAYVRLVAADSGSG